MKIVRKDQAVSHKNAQTCTAYEYELGHPDINIASIEVSGRYPEKGYATNKQCVEMVYIISGEISIYIEVGGKYDLAQGDTVMIEKGEKYYWDGTCSICVACTPAWYPQQHENIS